MKLWNSYISEVCVAEVIGAVILGLCVFVGMLLLGSTGKVIRSTNRNPGVAAVAVVTLSKLVIPLKVLNIDDKELSLMKEIILFNPGECMYMLSHVNHVHA